MAHLRFVFFSIGYILCIAFLPFPLWGQVGEGKCRWWQHFEDATLDSLMEVALRQNLSVQSARDRVEQARMEWRVQQGAFAPVVTLGGGWTRQRISGALDSGRPAAVDGAWEAEARLSWEVDVFGRIRRQVKAQRSIWEASRAEYREAQLHLCAAVAATYLQWREQQQVQQVLQRNARSQQAVVEMTEVRYRTGLVSKLDVAQAKSVYFSTQVALPAAEAAVLRSQHALAVLLGVLPEQLAAGLTGVRPLPVYVAAVGTTVSVDEVEARPDVQAAQHRVSVQRTLLGLARTAWWPTLSVQAAWGGCASVPKDLGRRGARTWRLAPALQWTLTHGGQRQNRIKEQRWGLEEQQHQYRQVVLQAVQEVSDAQTAYRNALRQQQACRSLEAQGQEVLALSLDLYKQGLTPFQNVLDAQRSLLAYEQERVRAQGWALQCLVQLYQALGGGPVPTGNSR